MKTRNHSGNVTIVNGTEHLVCSEDVASMIFIYFSAFSFNKIINKLSQARISLNNRNNNNKVRRKGSQITADY